MGQFFYHWGMSCLRVFSLVRAVAVGCALYIIVSPVHAEEKSMWNKFVEFFSPSSEVEGEGPLYDQLRELDRKINRVEGKYARERRPMNKDRYKKELAQLKADREELVKKIEAEEKKAPKSSSAEAKKSSAAVKSSSSSAVKAVSSSSMPACRPDTVFVRDTVVVRDTLYVMLAPKPQPVEESSSSVEAPADTAVKQ